MEIITEIVHPDEPCWGYFTGPRQLAGSNDTRMVEFVFVIRGDAIAKYVQDFGPADDFIYVPPLLMPSYGENNVGLMQWHGERHRNDEKWAKRMQEYKESSTLFADILRQEEEKRLAVKNQSVFGDYRTVMRNGYSRETTHRNWFEERDRRRGKKRFFTNG